MSTNAGAKSVSLSTRISHVFVRAAIVVFLLAEIGSIIVGNIQRAKAYDQKTYKTVPHTSLETLFSVRFTIKVTPLDNNMASIDSISVEINPPGLLSCSGSVARADYKVTSEHKTIDTKGKVLPDAFPWAFVPGGDSQTFSLYSASPGNGYIVSQGNSSVSFGTALTTHLWERSLLGDSEECGINGEPIVETVPIGGHNGVYDNPAEYIIDIPPITPLLRILPYTVTSTTSSSSQTNQTTSSSDPTVTSTTTNGTSTGQTTSTPSCQTASNGVTVYVGTNFQGNCKFYGVGQYTSLVSDGFDSNISSFRVGSGVTFFVNTGQNFSGNPGVFNADVSDAGKVGFNDNIRSLKIETVSSPSSQVTGDGIELCEGTNFGGHCDLFTEGSHDFSNTGWRDHIVAVKFLGSYVGNYHVTLIAENGGKYEADSDVSDLGDYYRDHIVSVNIVRKAPAKAELISPDDGQTFDSNTTEVVLVFKGPAPFRLHAFSREAGYDRYEGAWNDTSYHLTGLKPGFTYTWQVSANTGDWASPRIFSIASPQPTPTPVPTDTPTPALTDTPTPDNSTRPNGSSVQDSPTCGSTLLEGQTSVELIFEGQAPFRIHVWDSQTGWDDWKENWTDTTLTESDLEKGHTYNWQVSANVGDFGPLCTFTVHE